VTRELEGKLLLNDQEMEVERGLQLTKDWFGGIALVLLVATLNEGSAMQCLSKDRIGTVPSLLVTSFAQLSQDEFRCHQICSTARNKV
jgi:hypothetical protein